MTDKEKSRHSHLIRRWLITITIFVVIQLILFVVDGTFLEPNINDSNNLIARTGRWVLNLKLFTEWINPYSYPFFNMFMTIHIIAILIQAVHDIYSSMFSKSKEKG